MMVGARQLGWQRSPLRLLFRLLRVVAGTGRLRQLFKLALDGCEIGFGGFFEKRTLGAVELLATAAKLPALENGNLMR